MRVRVVPAALVFFACALAQQTLKVDQLVTFIRSSIQLKQPDREVAAYVSKLKLSERLEDRTIEELQGEGAGPKTVAALGELGTASASLPKPKPKAPPPAPLPPPAPPSSEEQQAIIEEVREYAMNYSKSLPDFICTQVTRRYYDPTGKESWRSQDTVTVHLTYFDQQEHYKLTLVNNTYVDLPYESLGGASSAGEFGSLLRSTLASKADALIEFDHWATLRGKRAYVFSYQISSGHSDWSILWERSMKIVTGYRGLLYVDRGTHKVLRITLEAVDIPSTFPVQEAGTVLDYDYVKISGQEFLLPLKAAMRMRHANYLTKNESEFRLYRKFSADATVTFDTPDPIPEDQTKEQPDQPKATPPK